MALYEMAFWHHALSTESFKVNRPYNSSTKILVPFPQAGVSHGGLEGLFAVSCCVVVGAEISLLSNFTLKLPHFLDAWNALSLLWGWLVMLSGRYSRTAPESSLSPRWWRYGNQLSNGWITAVVDKDAHQNQMLLALPPIRSQELGACRRRRRPTENGGTTPSLSDTGPRPVRDNRAAVGGRKTEERQWETLNVEEKIKFQWRLLVVSN